MDASLPLLREATSLRRAAVHAAAPAAARRSRLAVSAAAPAIVLDIAWDRPTIAQIRATGATGVMRYFSPDASKNLTAAEVRDYTAAGLSVGTVFESTAGRATQGWAAGVADAQLAEAQRKAVGLPSSHIHHFAVDSDVSWSSVQAYFDGATSVVTLAREGCYGGFRVVEGAYGHGIRFLWQTVAWSGGQVSSHATLYQNGATALAGAADINHALAADYGQYPSPLEPDVSTPLTVADAKLVANVLLNTTYPDLDLPDPAHPGQFLNSNVASALGYSSKHYTLIMAKVAEAEAKIDALAAKVASPPPVVLSDAQVAAMAAALAPAVADLLAKRLAN